MKHDIVFSPLRAGSSVIVTQQNGVCVLPLRMDESVKDPAREAVLLYELRRQGQVAALMERCANE